MKIKGKFCAKILGTVVLTSCVSTYGTDYYSDIAYKSLGVEGEKKNPSNVVQYIPGDPKTQQRIDKIAYEKPVIDHIGQSSKQSTQNSQSLSNNTVALANTNNYASNVNVARSVNQVHNTSEYYSSYLKTLSSYYLQYSNLFLQKNLLSDSQLLHSKSDTASLGHDVVFETENSFMFSAEKQVAISQKRKTLESIKSRIDILKAMPDMIARLQASYDCFVLDMKNTVPVTDGVCLIGYNDSLREIESRFGAIRVYDMQMPANIPQDKGVLNLNKEQVEIKQPLPPKTVVEKPSHFITNNYEYQDKVALKYDNQKSFVVYYDTGSANLNANAIYVVDKAISFAETYDQYTINVLGFTDRAADRNFNQKLSEKRANAVAQALIARGIPKEKVKIITFGEDYNSLPTSDNTPEPLNRRVVIEVQGSALFNEDTFIMHKSSSNSFI